MSRQNEENNLSSYITDNFGKPIHYYEYLPFGELMVEQNQSTCYNNGYKFNAKELDAATGMYYYGARYYDPSTSIFLSVDPLAEQFPGWTPYHYVHNNPINLIDPTGMSAVESDGPGDRFKTLPEAAIDFGKTYNANSIRDNKEYGTRIYRGETKSGESYYVYNAPNVGKEDGVSPYPNASAKEELVASAHTHGSYSSKYKNDVPSKTDKNTANSSNTMGYIATPNGAMLEYNPNTKKTIEISTATPSDVNHPARVNSINSSSFPKNEPTSGVGTLLLNNILIPLLQGSEAIKP